jgi:hypothetical protein
MGAPNPLAGVDAERVQWANHLLDEWKYRHDAFWQTLYRSLSAIAVLVAIPFVKTDFFRPIRDHSISIAGHLLSMRNAYVYLPLIIFVAMCGYLITEYPKQKQVERVLADVRDDHDPKRRRKQWEALRKRPLVCILFIVIGFGLWLLWVRVLRNLGADSSGNESAHFVLITERLEQ